MIQSLITLQREHIRVTDNNFNKKLTATYGHSLSSLFWTGNIITVSREIRNCITHNSGKATAKLKQMKPQPKIINGHILISASDVRVLYAHLKPVVTEVIGQSLKLLDARG